MGWHLGFSLLTTLWTRPNSSGGIGAREMDACFLMAAGWREGREGETYWTCGRCRARRLVDGTDEWRRGPTKRRNKRTVLYVLFLLAEPYTCRRVLPLYVESALMVSSPYCIFLFGLARHKKGRGKERYSSLYWLSQQSDRSLPSSPQLSSLLTWKKKHVEAQNENSDLLSSCVGFNVLSATRIKSGILSFFNLTCGAFPLQPRRIPCVE